jgi:hypothetical protein
VSVAEVSAAAAGWGGKSATAACGSNVAAAGARIGRFAADDGAVDGGLTTGGAVTGLEGRAGSKTGDGGGDGDRGGDGDTTGGGVWGTLGGIGITDGGPNASSTAGPCGTITVEPQCGHITCCPPIDASAANG